MHYIIYNKENKSYGDFYGNSEKEVWTQFEYYAKSKEVDRSRYEVVNITGRELNIIIDWFEKEYLMATVDKFIVDRKLKENN